MKRDISQLIAEETITIVEAMQRIDQNSQGILYIVRDEKLVGSLTDGDIRRFLMKSGNLKAPVSDAMYKKTRCVFKADLDRAQEIGKSLLQGVVSYCRVKGLNRIRLEVHKNNVNAITFYKRNGFEVIGDKTELSLLMSKSLLE